MGNLLIIALIVAAGGVAAGGWGLYLLSGAERRRVGAAEERKRIAERPAWAHPAVAASAFSGGANKGASGRPVPLLFEYVIGQS